MMNWGDVEQNRVILVDDDELFVEATVDALRDFGFSVHAFTNAASFLKALDLVREAKALLLDWALPGLTGLDLLDRVRRNGLTLPIAFLTGRPLVDYEYMALASGAVDFIDKTRGVEVIAKRLSRVIDSRWISLPSINRDRPVARGALSLRPTNQRAAWCGCDLGLTTTEYNIVHLLVTSDGRVSTYREIYDTMRYAGFVSGDGQNGHKTNVRSAIKRLRKKFWAIDPAFAEIVNHPTAGYSWHELPAVPKREPSRLPTPWIASTAVPGTVGATVEDARWPGLPRLRPDVSVPTAVLTSQQALPSAGVAQPPEVTAPAKT